MLRNAWSTALCRILPTPAHRLLPRSLVLLRYTARDGRIIEFPVQAATHGREVLVLAGSPDTKRWWRHFRGAERPIEVLIDGRWRTGVAQAWLGREQPLLIDRYLQKRPSATRWTSEESPAVVRINLAPVQLEHPDGTPVTEQAGAYGWKEHSAS